MGNVLKWPMGVVEARSDQPACIPPGIYELGYINHHVTIIHGAPKVALWFMVMTMGDYFQTPLARYYHVRSINRKNGSFKAGWHSDLVREYVRVSGQMPQRKDRVPLNRYKGLLILGRVYTVVKDRRQKELPGPSHYSVIGELLKVKQ